MGVLGELRRPRVVAVFVAVGLAVAAGSVLAKKRWRCCGIKIKSPIIQFVDDVRRGKPIDIIQTALGGPASIVPSEAAKAVSSAVNAATPKQVKDAIRGGERIADSVIKTIQGTVEATVQQVARQAEFVTGAAQATVTCVSDKNKCGRSLDGLKASVDKFAGDEIQWAGNRMVAMGKLQKDLAREMSLMKEGALEAFGQIQDSMRAVSGGPGSLFDPTAKGLEAFDRVLGDPGLKAAYDKYVVENTKAIDNITKQTFKIANEAGDLVSMGLGDVMIGSGTAISQLGYYLGLSAAGFPTAEMGAAPVLAPGEKSSFAATVSPAALNAILDGLQGERFAIGPNAKQPGDTKEFVQINDFEARFDPESRSIMVVAKDARVRAKVGSAFQTVKVGTLRLQLIPSMKTTRLDDGQHRVMLSLRPKALHLDVEDMPTRMDQALTYVLNDTALKDTMDVDVSVLAPVPKAETTVAASDGKKEIWIRRAAFAPKKVDFLMQPNSFTLRSVGTFERISDVKKS